LPIYEYRCQSCAKLTSFFLKSINSELEPVCTHCESKDMERRMSSFAMGKTVASVHENFVPGSERRSPDYAFSKHGMDMPQSVRDNIDAARSGEAPKGLEL